jgi:hypothetical protein
MVYVDGAKCHVIFCSTNNESEIHISIFICGNNYLCIKAQKVHLFRPSLGFLVEAEPRFENRGAQEALFGRGTHNVFRIRLGKKNKNKPQLKQVSCIKQKLKKNLKFFAVNLMCGTLSLYAHFLGFYDN